jgi:hypothetical protein
LKFIQYAYTIREEQSTCVIDIDQFIQPANCTVEMWSIPNWEGGRRTEKITAHVRVSQTYSLTNLIR